MKRKWLVIGIILLFVGTCIISTAIRATSINDYRKNLYERECSPLRENVTVTFTFPENGIYWNDHKIAPFSVPLIIHYYFNSYILVKFEIEPKENISKIEFYYNDALISTWSGPGPFPISGQLPISRFSHANLKIIAYINQGDWGSDEVTIWRLFL